MQTPRSSDQSIPTRRAIAQRILASFGVTVLAFGLTVGWSVFSQRRGAEDSEELAKGFVPVALKLAELRAAQAALATLVDGIPEERSPTSMRILLETLETERRALLVETRRTMTEDLMIHGRADARELAVRLAGEIDSISHLISQDSRLFEQVFLALAAGERETVVSTVRTLGAVELEGMSRLRSVAERIAHQTEDLSQAASRRERSAIGALIGLLLVTLLVAAIVFGHVKKVLAPLSRVTERAKAVAAGDLTPQTALATNDELGELSASFERMVSAVSRAQSLALSNERLAAIGKMAAHVTHEIRNPLSALGLNIELLEEELANANVRGEAASLLVSIRREVERLEQLSEEYLRVARLPSPSMEADRVADVVGEVVEFSRPEIERAGCTIRFRAGDVSPAMFDESQLRQALLNLIRNARESMPDGGAIDVSVLAEGMSVVIEVADRGGGIPDEIRPRVVDPFFSTKGEGTGLGLAITRHIVEAHGGNVTCVSREGGGTRFRITLPIAPARSSMKLVAAS